MKSITVITPVYNEEENVETCYQIVKNIFREQLPHYRYEHIFADNDSRDATPEILKRIAAQDENVKVIFNARNFGPIRSNFNALLAANGDAILVSLPVDLQDPPELIPQFVKLWEDGNDVVYGIRKKRPEGIILRNVRSLFYRLVTAWTPFPVPTDVGEFQLIDRRVLNVLREFDDYYPYIRGMIAYCGFRSVGIPFVWKPRHSGIAKSSIANYTDQAINGLISFNNFPLRVCFVLGICIAIGSVGFGIVSLIAALLSADPAPPGIPTLIVAQFFLSGVLLFVIGVLSEYVYAIYSTIRRRPMVVERGRLNFDSSTDPQGPSGS
jgi:glycosyltransferase involved in cell wall biosynthesis